MKFTFTIHAMQKYQELQELYANLTFKKTSGTILRLFAIVPRQAPIRMAVTYEKSPIIIVQGNIKLISRRRSRRRKLATN